MRAPNTVDFWRGFALLEIVVNHIPDQGLTRLTHSQFSWSDAAELFVFLAGWTFARRLVRRDGGDLHDVLAFTGNRVAKIWLGQALMALLIAGIYLNVARYTSDVAILADNRASLAQTAPGDFLAGVLLLTQQIRFVDILPLYVLLALATPAIWLLNRRSTLLLATASASLFAVSLFWRPALPTWPEPGQWFFQPLSWQAMFVAGFIVGQKRDLVSRLVDKNPAIIPVACLLVAFSIATTVAGWTPPAEPPPDSLAYYFFGKSSLGLLPLPQFLALALVVSRVTHLVPRFLPPLWRLLSLLGRNSLSVFCAGTVVSAIGQICHRAGWRGAAFDIVFALGAAALLCGIAKARETLRAASRVEPVPEAESSAIRV